MMGNGNILYVRNIDGTLSPVKQVDNKLRVSSTPYLFDIAAGNIPGHTVFTKVGYQPVTATSDRALWNVASDYVFPTTAMQMEVVSTSTDDDGSPAGIGARTITIYYLDSTFTEKSTVVVMDGTTIVQTTATDIYRINAFRVTTTGTNNSAVGTITLRNLNHTTIYDQIAPGYNASRTLIYTVPKNKTLYMTNVTLSAGYSSSGKQVIFTTKATYDPFTGAQTTGMFFIPFTEIVLIDNIANIDLQIPTRFPAGTDLKITVAGETNAKCTAQIRGWLE